MNVYLLIAFVVVLVSAAVAGLIVLDHHLENKRNEKIGEIISDDVIPAAGNAIEEVTMTLMDDIGDKMKKWMDSFNQ